MPSYPSYESIYPSVHISSPQPSVQPSPSRPAPSTPRSNPYNEFQKANAGKGYSPSVMSALYREQQQKVESHSVPSAAAVGSRAVSDWDIFRSQHKGEGLSPSQMSAMYQSEKASQSSPRPSSSSSSASKPASSQPSSASAASAPKAAAEAAERRASLSKIAAESAKKLEFSEESSNNCWNDFQKTVKGLGLTKEEIKFMYNDMLDEEQKKLSAPKASAAAKPSSAPSPAKPAASVAPKKEEHKSSNAWNDFQHSMKDSGLSKEEIQALYHESVAMAGPSTPSKKPVVSETPRSTAKAPSLSAAPKAKIPYGDMHYHELPLTKEGKIDKRTEEFRKAKDLGLCDDSGAIYGKEVLHGKKFKNLMKQVFPGASKVTVKSLFMANPTGSEDFTTDLAKVDKYREGVTSAKTRHADHAFEVQHLNPFLKKNALSERDFRIMVETLNDPDLNMESRGEEANKHKGRLTTALINSRPKLSSDAIDNAYDQAERAEVLADAVEAKGSRVVANALRSVATKSLLAARAMETMIVKSDKEAGKPGHPRVPRDVEARKVKLQAIREEYLVETGKELMIQGVPLAFADVFEDE